MEQHFFCLSVCFVYWIFLQSKMFQHWIIPKALINSNKYWYIKNSIYKSSISRIYADSPSICCFCVKFSRPVFLVMCARNFNCLSLFFLKSSLLLMCSGHGILSIVSSSYVRKLAKRWMPQQVYNDRNTAKHRCNRHR